MSNEQALLELVDGDGSLPAVLALTLARELDRQAAEGRGVNANLVKEYREVLEGLISSDDSVTVDMLAKIRNAKASGAA